MVRVTPITRENFLERVDDLGVYSFWIIEGSDRERCVTTWQWGGQFQGKAFRGMTQLTEKQMIESRIERPVVIIYEKVKETIQGIT